MKIRIDFEPNLGLLAHRIYKATTEDTLPINISKAWVDEELRNYFYLNGINMEHLPYDDESWQEALRVNDKYDLYLKGW